MGSIWNTIFLLKVNGETRKRETIKKYCPLKTVSLRTGQICILMHGTCKITCYCTCIHEGNNPLWSPFDISFNVAILCSALYMYMYIQSYGHTEIESHCYEIWILSYMGVHVHVLYIFNNIHIHKICVIITVLYTGDAFRKYLLEDLYILCLHNMHLFGFVKEISNWCSMYTCRHIDLSPTHTCM